MNPWKWNADYQQKVRRWSASKQLIQASRDWTLPAVMRSYRSGGRGHKQFADEALIFAEHGYQPFMQSAEGGHLRPLLLLAGPGRGKLTVTFTKQEVPVPSP